MCPCCSSTHGGGGIHRPFATGSGPRKVRPAHRSSPSASVRGRPPSGRPACRSRRRAARDRTAVAAATRSPRTTSTSPPAASGSAGRAIATGRASGRVADAGRQSGRKSYAVVGESRASAATAGTRPPPGAPAASTAASSTWSAPGRVDGRLARAAPRRAANRALIPGCAQVTPESRRTQPDLTGLASRRPIGPDPAPGAALRGLERVRGGWPVAAYGVRIPVAVLRNPALAAGFLRSGPARGEAYGGVQAPSM